MKVLVTGSRHWTDWRVIYKHLDLIGPDEVVQGGAKGADAFAHQWAKKHGKISTTYFADWSIGPHAGPIRNATMVAHSKPDMVLAYGSGRGTMGTVKVAQEHGIAVQRTLWEGDKE